MDKVEYIDKNAVKRLLDAPQLYVDPFEIPGFYEAMDDVPVVEAIPVEWIEKWFKKALRWANDGDDVTVDVMLDDWRKENGQQ